MTSPPKSKTSAPSLRRTSRFLSSTSPYIIQRQRLRPQLPGNYCLANSTGAPQPPRPRFIRGIRRANRRRPFVPAISSRPTSAAASKPISTPPWRGSSISACAAISPAQYESYIQIDDQRAILSISPELFLRVTAGIVESSPIKGTRPRAHDAAEDQALSAELLTSEKDRAELAMIVDVVRNDLGRVCETGSVEVTQHAALMTLPTVHHLYSTVKGRLRTGLVDLLRAAFPAASITGAPKIEAIRAAMREEGQLRGPCMGAIGWISMDGNMELSVAIRTAFTSDGQVRYYAGCGITADSDPHTEFIESSHKAAAFVRALEEVKR